MGATSTIESVIHPGTCISKECASLRYFWDGDTKYFTCSLGIFNAEISVVDFFNILREFKGGFGGVPMCAMPTRFLPCKVHEEVTTEVSE